MQTETVKKVVAISTKNVGLAIILTVIFGPLGMLYSTISGGIMMIVTGICILIIAAVSGPKIGFGVFILLGLLWEVVCIIWAAAAASSYNRKLLSDTAHD